jgi:hypothetical protein
MVAPLMAESDDETTDGRLSTSRFSDESERLALADRETDIGHGLDRAQLAMENGAIGYREILHEVVDHEDRIALRQLIDSNLGTIERSATLLGGGHTPDRQIFSAVRADRVEAGKKMCRITRL